MNKAKLRMFVNRLFESSELHHAYSQKKNTEIADMLLEKVWADLDFDTEEAILVDIAIERLREK